MNPAGETVVANLLDRRYRAARALLNLVSGWSGSPIEEDEAGLTARLEECRQAVDRIVRIESALDEAGWRRDAAAAERAAGAEQIGKTSEMLGRIQRIMTGETEKIKEDMACCLREAARARTEKSGLEAYLSNGRPIQRERVDLRG